MTNDKRPDTPHIKRFEEIVQKPDETASDHLISMWNVAQASHDLLAEHIERLEHRMELAEQFVFKLPPGVSIDHLSTDTAPSVNDPPKEDI